MRVMLSGNSRDSSRASRSGGAEKITVSLIGEALTGRSAGACAGSALRAGRIEPVVFISPPSAVVRCSNVACRCNSALSFCSNCSWSSNCRLVMRSTCARNSAMRSS
jgi:hypothetical protein